MSDIKFICPHCKQSLEAPPDMLGQLIDCPSCSQSIEVQMAKPPLSTPPPPQKLTRACPFCSEEILMTARKCKHCGEILDESLREQRSTAPSDHSPSPQIVQEKVVVKPRGEGCFLQTCNVGCGIIFIVIAVIVIFIIYVLNQ